MESLKLHVTQGRTESAQEAYTKLSPGFDSADIQEVSNPLDADFRLVLGGDGSMLHAARQDVTSQDLPPVFGIKAGHKAHPTKCIKASVGFLLNDIDWETPPDQLADAIRSSIHSRFRFLEGILGDTTIHAFNDIATHRKPGQSARSQLTARDKETVVKYGVGGDGMVFCTAQGSTAYNLNAGGRIFTDVNNIQATGKVDGAFGSINLSRDSEFELTPHTEEGKRPAPWIEFDDSFIDWPQSVENLVVRLSDKMTHICFLAELPHQKKLMEYAANR